jgi:hypothetical protein
MIKTLYLVVALTISTVASANTSSPPGSMPQQERSYVHKKQMNADQVAAQNTEQPASSVSDVCTMKIYTKDAPEPVPALTVNMDPGANTPNAYCMNCYIYSHNGTQFSEKYREKSKEV